MRTEGNKNLFGSPLQQNTSYNNNVNTPHAHPSSRLGGAVRTKTNSLSLDNSPPKDITLHNNSLPYQYQDDTSDSKPPQQVLTALENDYVYLLKKVIPLYLRFIFGYFRGFFFFENVSLI